MTVASLREFGRAGLPAGSGNGLENLMVTEILQNLFDRERKRQRIVVLPVAGDKCTDQKTDER